LTYQGQGERDRLPREALAKRGPVAVAGISPDTSLLKHFMLPKSKILVAANADFLRGKAMATPAIVNSSFFLISGQICCNKIIANEIAFSGSSGSCRRKV
jgi:hypothetical protein